MLKLYHQPLFTASYALHLLLATVLIISSEEIETSVGKKIGYKTFKKRKLFHVEVH